MKISYLAANHYTHQDRLSGLCHQKQNKIMH